MSTHTPGPWTVGSYPVGHIGIEQVGKPEAYYVAHANVSSSRPFAETQANAHLIAAAPELLRELKACLRLIAQLEENMGGPLLTGDAARDVVAKAEGRS